MLDASCCEHGSYDEPVGVIIEAKQPSNKAEMVSLKNPNCKSFQQLVYYYFTERISGNKDIKHLVITNIYEWYIFDAKDFEILFYDNIKLRKEFDEFKSKSTIKSDTSWFYSEITKPFIEELDDEIPCTYFNLKDYEQVILNDNLEDDNDLLNLYKILSPEHLLKKQTANDSNSLNDKFYKELLHIVGLEEVKEGSKKTIQRCNVRNDGSLLENTLNKLRKDFVATETEDEQYSIALELCITWLNRILFLKLLEGQLIKYNNSQDFAFLNYSIIKDYDELEELFFEVLAENYKDRTKTVNEKYGNIPYLNSSLFEKTDLEKKYFGISVLKNRLDMPIQSQTVLNSISKGDTKKTLDYLFEFLNAYDFGDVSTGKIKEQSKSIINASVLGLIFEKLNGYKDGSFYTPGFITMYMCRESIQRAIIQRFNTQYDWNCIDMTDLYNRVDKIKIQEANELINSMKICDPSVGSGHFLVSALNELIAIKSRLEILADKDFKRIKGYNIEIDNDELIIKDEEGKLYEYNPRNAESRRIQETLFNEKQTVIENCLFGVDINTKSVMICRLRLWIELLKNAYYTDSSKYEHLETLPNIDINIKCGNSLISRFGLDTDVSQMLKKSKWNIDAYQIAVERYKNAETKDEKREMEQLISTIKQEFRSEISLNDPLYLKLRKLNGELFSMTNQGQLFAMTDEEKKTWNQKLEKLHTESSKLETQIEEIKSNKIYDNSFEWRFEFPEVLDDNGNFKGFDVVIGNPPYIQLQRNNGELARQLSHFDYQTLEKTGDIYCVFYELGFKILNSKGVHCFITSSQWTKASYGHSLRKYLLSKNPERLILLGAGMFESAVVDTNILLATNEDFQNQLKGSVITQAESIEDIESIRLEDMTNVSEQDWSIYDNLTQSILDKVKVKSKPLSEWDIKIYRGILTGFNEAFIIDQTKRDELVKSDKKNEEIIRPILRGREIEKYNTVWDGGYLVGTFPALKIDIKKYPTIESYLDSFQPKLNQVGESFINKEGKEDKTRKKSHNKWFETQDPIAYHKEFSKEKIIWKRIGSQLRFSYSDSEIYSLDSTCIATGEKIKYLTGLLNSKLCYFQLFNSAPKTGMGDLIISVQALEPLLVHYPNAKFESQIVKIVDKILSQKQKDPKADTTGLEAEIDRLVYELYGLSMEEVELIKK